MIQLHPDYLMFELPNGDSVPCSAETVTFELIGDAVDDLDPEVVKNAAAAVLHYFQKDLKRESVSVGEFSEALEEVLRGFGFKVETACTTGAKPAPAKVAVRADLDSLARATAGSGELWLFSLLRDELGRKLPDAGAGRLDLLGLRPCVKELLGASRWSPRCENLSDRIVGWVRDYLSREEAVARCAVMIR
jgi:hypothetical protein